MTTMFELGVADGVCEGDGACDGVWLTVVEAGRWDEVIGSVVADVQERERDVVAHLLADRLRDLLADAALDHRQLDPHVDIVLALVRGLRVARISPRGAMSADRAAAVLRDALSGAR